MFETLFATHGLYSLRRIGLFTEALKQNWALGGIWSVVIPLKYNYVVFKQLFLYFESLFLKSREKQPEELRVRWSVCALELRHWAVFAPTGRLCVYSTTVPCRSAVRLCNCAGVYQPSRTPLCGYARRCPEAQAVLRDLPVYRLHVRAGWVRVPPDSLPGAGGGRGVPRLAARRIFCLCHRCVPWRFFAGEGGRWEAL